MIYYLKADTRKEIEDAIPFDLYTEDEDGNEILIKSTPEYDYHFIGHEVLEEAEFDEDGNITKDPVFSDYVLANLQTREPVQIGDSAEQMNPDTPKHRWA